MRGSCGPREAGPEKAPRPANHYWVTVPRGDGRLAPEPACLPPAVSSAECFGVSPRIGTLRWQAGTPSLHQPVSQRQVRVVARVSRPWCCRSYQEGGNGPGDPENPSPPWPLRCWAVRVPTAEISVSRNLWASLPLPLSRGLRPVWDQTDIRFPRLLRPGQAGRRQVGGGREASWTVRGRARNGVLTPLLGHSSPGVSLM